MERRPTVAARLDEILDGLPDEIGVGHSGGQRLVVSTAGVFVLDPEPDGTEAAAGAAPGLAVVTRESLAEKLSWVPFVDWFIVTDEGAGASHLPADLVELTVLEGHCVDDAISRRITTLLGFGALDPPWYPGLPDPTHDRGSSVTGTQPLS